MRVSFPSRLSTLSLTAAVLLSAAAPNTFAQGGDRMTAVQREIQRQRQRLTSSEVEERRDAVMRLGSLKRVDASRAAAVGLNDPAPMVRVTAAHAILSLPPQEAVALLTPLLQDKLEFVRRETAYALRETRNRSPVQPLAPGLLVDNDARVRVAAAVAP